MFSAICTAVIESPIICAMPTHRTCARAWLLLASIAAVGCATTKATHPVPQPFPTPTERVDRGLPEPEGSRGRAAVIDPAPISQSPALALVSTALALRGTPYRNGGSDTEGFDCSGFTRFVFAQHGVHLPREVRDQFQLGEKIDRDDVAPGDLVFFNTSSHGPSHVAIAVGRDEFVHAPSSRGVVRIEHLSSQYWARRLIGVRRVTGS